MRRQAYKRLAGMAAFLCAWGICIPALAASGTSGYEDGPVSNIWLGVVEHPSLARISVTVPTSYGFAVVGSVDPANMDPVTSAGGTILLPNIRVEALAPENAADPVKYEIAMVGPSQVPIQNYSTDVREENMGIDNPPREGLPVEVKPYMMEIPQTALNAVTGIQYWEPIGTDPTGIDTLFKRYRMGLDGKWFDTPGNISDGTASHSVYFLGENLKIPAPPDVAANGWNAGGLAKIPYSAYFNVDVQAGGVRSQYNQAEQSVKVGQIGWEIIPGKLPGTAP